MKSGMHTIISKKVSVDLSDGKMYNTWEHNRQEIVTCLNCANKKVIVQLSTQAKIEKKKTEIK